LESKFAKTSPICCAPKASRTRTARL
jgi:hypothetical protein